MESVLEALLTGAGMLWKALWALAFGYLVSGGIQVLVTRERMARALGERGLREASLAGFFGFISSSCSFAALASSRTVLAKGAHPTNALAFLVASTNLVVELGIVLFVLLSWHFVLGNFLLGLLMIVYGWLLMRVWLPEGMVEAARERARAGEGEVSGEEERDGWRVVLATRRGWARIADAFFWEWGMVWKEIIFGFTVAGFISVFVPQAFWDALFLEAGSGAPSFLAVVENAAVAPLVAFFTFIGSMGNVPLAAMLWGSQASFGGVMSFLGADLVAATVIYIHAKYYGLRYALYLSGLLYVAMVAAGVTVHYVFAIAGILPTERPTLQDVVRFELDYTFWLNLTFAGVAVALLLVRRGWGSQP